MAEKDVIINMFDMFPDHKNHHNPLVFQCSKCMTIIGDSLSWKFSNEAQQIICLSRITQSINVDRDVHISQSNKQQMSTFSKLICQGCLTCIGRIYHSTSMDFDQFRGLYSLDAKRISCYKTGEDSNESIFNSLETADPVKYVLVSMDERLRAVEKKLGMTRGMMGNNDISVEETSNIHDSQQSESTLIQHADSQEERHSVCELHYQPKDIKREISAFDQRTGTTITVKLQRRSLPNGAILRILPNCPPYLHRPASESHRILSKLDWKILNLNVL